MFDANIGGEDSRKEWVKRGKTKYVIEDLFPAGRVHLIGGASGAGKTTLVFQMYKALTNTPPSDFLGRRTIPVKWAYISGDRSVESVFETQDRLATEFPVFSLVDHSLVGADLTGKILPRLPGFYGYKPDFIFIDGFTGMCPDGQMNNYSIVSTWLAGLQRYCKKTGITILGACHTTKTKEGEGFKDPRQKILGSVAWASYSEGIIIVEVEEDNPKKRIVSILPRNHPIEIINMSISEDGTLELPDKVARQDSYSGFIIENILEPYRKVPGMKLDYRSLLESVVAKGAGRRTFDRFLAKEVELGRIIKEGKGNYVIGIPNDECGEVGISIKPN